MNNRYGGLADRVPAAIAKPFGICRRRWLFFFISMALLLLITVLFIWHISTSGCVLFSHGCGLSELGGSDFVGIGLALVVLFWSIGISIGQSEQFETLQKMTSADQRFDSDFVLQLAKLNEYIGEIPDAHDKLEMQIYVSSPAFGFLTGHKGMYYFVEIIRKFVEASKKRAIEKKDSSLLLYFWEEKEHRRIFGPTAKQRKPIWGAGKAKEKEREKIAGHVRELMRLFKEIQTSNVKHIHDPAYNHVDGQIRVYQFDVRRDECRFFMLDTGKEQRAAMIAMAPIGGEKNADLHSILLLDNTKAMDKIRQFSMAFMSHASISEDAGPIALTKGEKLCKDPRTFFEKYFGYDFNACPLPSVPQPSVAAAASARRVSKGNGSSVTA